MVIKKKVSVRFNPDFGTTAKLKGPFEDIFGLVINESHTGFAMVCILESPIATEQIFRAKVGNLPTLKAELIWIKKLDGKIYKMGFRYLE